MVKKPERSTYRLTISGLICELINNYHLNKWATNLKFSGVVVPCFVKCEFEVMIDNYLENNK